MGLVGLWAVLAASLPTRTERIAVTALIVVLCLAGLLRAPRLYPHGNHASLPAIRFVRDYHQDGDLILVADPTEVNQTRHTAAQLGFERADVRCLWEPFDHPGFANHFASLRGSDIIWHDRIASAEHAPRIWRLSEDEGFAGVRPFGMKRVVERTFEGSEKSRVTLALYVPVERETVSSASRMIDLPRIQHDEGTVCSRLGVCPEVAVKAYRLGVHIVELPIRNEAWTRQAGKKVGWRDGLEAFSMLW